MKTGKNYIDELRDKAMDYLLTADHGEKDRLLDEMESLSSGLASYLSGPMSSTDTALSFGASSVSLRIDYNTTDPAKEIELARI